MGTTNNDQPKQPWFKKPVVWGIIAGLIVIGSIGNALSPKDETPTKAPAASAETVPDPEEPVSPAAESDLPDRINAAITSSGHTPTWWLAVYEVEDAGSYIRLHVQEKLDKDDRARLAQYTRNFTEAADIELGTIVIRDLTGRETNHFNR